MARVSKSNNIVSGIGGKLGSDIIFKQYYYGCVATKYPDMSRVKRTPRQQGTITKFQQAVFFAKGVINNEVLRAQYTEKFKKELLKGRSLYHLALSEYMKR